MATTMVETTAMPTTPPTTMTPAEMTIVKLMAHLRELDIKLWLEDDRLRFRAPNGVMTPELRTQLKERKSEILAFLREAQENQVSTTGTIQPVLRDETLPLSFAQERLWFLDRLEERQGSTYNMPAALQLTGPLDVVALEQSFNELVRRHEILRTTFQIARESPVQVIAPDLYVALPVMNLQNLPDDKQRERVQQLATAEAERPFDLEQGPLLRVSLLRLGEESHVLLLTMHHIVSDGWSLEILIQEVTALYHAFSTNTPSPLPDLSIQYADYAHWQRQRLQGEVMEAELGYWKEQLVGAPPLLELPTDHPRPPVQTFRGAKVLVDLDAELTQRLKQLSQQAGTTLFMTLLAAFDVLLARYSGQTDIVVGTPVAGRTHQETEPLIGFFINTLLLRTNLTENPTFQELLAQVQQTTVDAFSHQAVPFEKLVEELQPERNLSHTPLYQAMFVFQPAVEDELALSGLTITPLETGVVRANDDVLLLIEETAMGLRAEWEYSADLFDTTTIQRMAGHFENLLRAILTDPSQPILLGWLSL